MTRHEAIAHFEAWGEAMREHSRLEDAGIAADDPARLACRRRIRDLKALVEQTDSITAPPLEREDDLLARLV